MIQFAVSKGCVDQLSAKSGWYRTTRRAAICLLVIGLTSGSPPAIAHPGHSHDGSHDEHHTPEPSQPFSGADTDSTGSRRANWYTYVLWSAFGVSLLGSRIATRCRPQRASGEWQPRPAYQGILPRVAAGLLIASCLVGGATLCRVWQDASFDPVATAWRRLAAALAAACGSWAVFGALALAAQKWLLRKATPTGPPVTGAWLLLVLTLAANLGLVARWAHDPEGHIGRSCFVAIAGLSVLGGGIAGGYARQSANLAHAAALAWGLTALAVLARGFHDDASVRSIDSHVVGGMMLVASLILWRCQRLETTSANASSPDSLASAKDPK